MPDEVVEMEGEVLRDSVPVGELDSHAVAVTEAHTVADSEEERHREAVPEEDGDAEVLTVSELLVEGHALALREMVPDAVAETEAEVLREKLPVAEPEWHAVAVTVTLTLPDTVEERHSVEEAEEDVVEDGQ